MICDFCFCVVPDEEHNIDPAVMMILALEKDTERMCERCLHFYAKKPYLLDENVHHVNRAIGSIEIKEEYIETLREQYGEEFSGGNESPDPTAARDDDSLRQDF